MMTAQKTDPPNTIWDEYFQLPAYRHLEGWRVLRSGYRWRDSYWCCFWDWRKFRAYRRWQKKWGLK